MTRSQFIGISFGDRVGGDRAIYHRQLNDGTLLVARVKAAGGRPQVDEIVARLSDPAKDFGREIAITELEKVVNDNDTWSFPDARTAMRVSPFVLSEIPIGVPLRGSRGRPTRWTDRRYAELVRDLQDGDSSRWYLERNTIRQRANEAVRRGIALVSAEAPPKRWRLTAHGAELLEGEEGRPPQNFVDDHICGAKGHQRS
jgi:hypothetical protein